MRNVLVCRLDNAGDVLLTGPAVRAVRAGADAVVFLCSPRGRAAAELLPGVDEVLEHRAGWVDVDRPPIDRKQIAELIEAIHSRDITEALVFTSFHQSPLPTALILRLAGVRSIAAISDDYPGSLLDVRHRIDPDIHEVERNLSLAATLGFRLPAGDDGRLHVLQPPSAPVILPPDPFIVVHPGSSAPARTGPAELFEATATMLADNGWWVAVTGSAEEATLTAQVARNRRRVFDMGAKTTLGELAGVMSKASAVVTGNSGPAHLATAVDTPVVAVFPPTVPAVRWRPWGVSHRLLGDQDVACAGCRAVTCPVPGQPCLSGVTALEVVGAVRHVISNRDFVLPAIANRTVVA